MANKFDTNPLDPEFPEKARVTQTGAAGGYTAPQNTPFKTAEFPKTPFGVTEEETRRLNEAQFNSYGPQPAQAEIQFKPSAPIADFGRASDRKVAKAGISEKWLIGLPYIPYLGLFAGLVLLVILPKEEPKVRFHAAQGLAANVAVWVISALLSFVGNFTDFADFARGIFKIISTIMLGIFAIKAWSGKPVHIEAVDDLTNWLEEKIGPYKI